MSLRHSRRLWVKSKPSPGIRGERAYHVPRPRGPLSLFLDGNEGLTPSNHLISTLRREGVGVLRSYPSTGNLALALAERFQVSPEQVLVTAGADDALDRLCRAVLWQGRKLLLPEPTFEMIRRYAKMTGARIESIPWAKERFPTRAIMQALTRNTGLVAVVTPNNPTGGVATRKDLRRLVRATVSMPCWILLDHAYVEFARDDLTRFALQCSNVVVIRTFSKAWGLAGLRVGFALGSKEVIEWMRIAGNPYAVTGPSVAMAIEQLKSGEKPMRRFVRKVKGERSRLEAWFRRQKGMTVFRSQANFVFIRTPLAPFLANGLGSLGISIRTFPRRNGLEDALRITCPGEEKSFVSLIQALDVVCSPQALLFDMDGVLVDVSRSYRQAILRTVRSFGGSLKPADIARAKARGNANNDWVLCRALLAQQGIHVSLAKVTKTFEEFYQGTHQVRGLRENETLLVSRKFLHRLSRRLPLAIVTGRPRVDLERILTRERLRPYFSAAICMEDGPLKPDPQPVRLALQRLGVKRAWMIGDAPDDIRSAIGTGRVLPLAVLPPHDPPGEVGEALISAGAAKILKRIEEVEENLP